MDNNDCPVGDIIYLQFQNDPMILHSLAHELRHCWQEYRGKGFYQNYKDLNEIGGKYILQPEEIDAEAFASLYLNTLGYDGIKMVFETEEEYNHTSWGPYIALIKKQMEIISKDNSLGLNV